MRTRRDYYLFLKVLTLSIIDIYKNILSLKEKTHFTPSYEKYIERFRKSAIHFLYCKPAIAFQYMNFIPQVNNKFSLFTKFDMGRRKKEALKRGLCCVLYVSCSVMSNSLSSHGL